jgi:hypothetical protein
MFELGPVVTTAIVASIGSVGLWKVVEKSLERWWNRTDTLEDKHARCVEEVEELKARVAVIEHHHTSYLARWIRDATRRVVWINDKALLSIFAPLDLTREQVIGKTLAELPFDQVAVAEVDRLDAAALAHPEVAASNVIQMHPLLPLMVIVKVAAVGRDGELVFEGYAYRTNDRMIADGFGADRQRRAIEASSDHMLGGDPD